MFRLRAVVLVCSVLLLTGLVSCQQEPAITIDVAQPAQDLDLTFGVYTSDKATTMYRKFTPVLERLQERVEEQLKTSVSIELRIFRTYDQGLQALIQGKVDFVRFGPASFVLARQKNPKVHLLAVELKKGKRKFKGMIVVRKDSKIQKLGDLRGKSFAFGDPNSTIGRYLAQDRLLAAGIHGKKLREFRFLGRHDKVFRAVEYGDYDAGSVKSGTFKKLNTKGQLRVLVTFDNVTKPWIASSRLKPRVVTALRAALLGLRDKESLQSLKVSGFGKAEDEHFAMIRKSMDRAAGFDASSKPPK